MTFVTGNPIGMRHNEGMKHLKLDQDYAWVYLLNLGFYLLPMLLFPYSTWQLLIMSAVLVGFIVTYYSVYRCTDQQRPWRIALLFCAAVLMSHWNPGTIAMFGFVSFFLGFYYQGKRAFPLIGALIATLFAIQWQIGTYWDYFAMYGAFLVVLIGLFGVIERQRCLRLLEQQQSEAEIRRLAASVERERIARDLHDILGHTLSSIALKANLAEKQLQKQHYNDAQQQVHELNAIARDSLRKVRESVSGFRHNGLDNELKSLEHYLNDAGFKVTIQGDLPELSKASEQAVILALTELATNMIRHSQGQACHIRFVPQAETLTIEISDDGDCPPFTEGNGLQGIRERLEALNGRFDYHQQHGCTFCLTLPLPAPKATP